MLGYFTCSSNVDADSPGPMPIQSHYGTTYHLSKDCPPADEEGSPPSYCSATYFNPEGPVIETEEGTTEGEAVEVLYQKLKRMGYDRSKLPNPEPR